MLLKSYTRYSFHILISIDLFQGLIIVLCVSLINAGYPGPTNQGGIDLIKKFEGFHSNFYFDPSNIRTIGYGHACHFGSCMIPLNGQYYPPLTEADATGLLLTDLRDRGYENCIRLNIKWSGLNTNQFSALASFVFNIGCQNFKSSTLAYLLNQGNTLGASLEFKKWIYSHKKILPGLIIRREAERVLFCSLGGCDITITSNKRISIFYGRLYYLIDKKMKLTITNEINSVYF